MKNNNEIIIRELREMEFDVLEDMLYQSIYQPDETNPIAREVISIPSVRVYIDGFGKKKDDHCIVADLNGKVIGAVWVRILADEIKGYGNVDDETPEFAISLFKEYRKRGIGTLLMKKMISYLKKKNYKQTSLSVQKENYAVRMYRKLGFEIIGENDDDYLMLLDLKNTANKHSRIDLL